MIGFKLTGVTAPNTASRPPTAAGTYPKRLTFEKSRLGSIRSRLTIWLQEHPQN